MGKEMGFLPGGIDDKMDPWLQPIYDNLDQIVGQQARQKMIRDGAIKLQPLPYIRGRSLVNALLIVDESQNLTPHEVKTIITRAGRGTRIILTGDPDQIDNPYVDRLSNGLTYAADRLGHAKARRRRMILMNCSASSGKSPHFSSRIPKPSLRLAAKPRAGACRRRRCICSERRSSPGAACR